MTDSHWITDADDRAGLPTIDAVPPLLRGAVSLACAQPQPRVYQAARAASPPGGFLTGGRHDGGGGGRL